MVVPPSERFVWAMTFLIIALVGAVSLEAIHIIVVHMLDDGLLNLISGLVGSITTAVLLESKR